MLGLGHLLGDFEKHQVVVEWHNLEFIIQNTQTVETRGVYTALILLGPGGIVKMELGLCMASSTCSADAMHLCSRHMQA